MSTTTRAMRPDMVHRMFRVLASDTIRADEDDLLVMAVWDQFKGKATSQEFIRAVDLTVRSFRELVALEQIDRAHVVPKTETPPRRRRAKRPAQLPLFDQRRAR